VPGDPDLHARLDRLARASRMLFVAGLPGTGKSLLVHQLAHLAAGAGRVVHLLQWDVARPVLEASAAARRYPAVDGVTHAMVRKAVGVWSRRAVIDWERQWTDSTHLLLGETPFVGNRLIELARPADDDTEALLAAPTCRFTIAVPSADVRRFLEAERERRAAAPLHPREREDAPPPVLRDLWRQLDVPACLRGPPATSPRRGRPAPHGAAHCRRVRLRLRRAPPRGQAPRGRGGCDRARGGSAVPGSGGAGARRRSLVGGLMLEFPHRIGGRHACPGSTSPT
jgi:hypothetical protein